ncbi:hypothetical protein ACFRMQ_02025 [Kitasatospora sp. NPDC056783]|uniref:hypothetical protein n=1 Tax=Kitasatospora sp. NPDC056783 TaxID=3345943 RepID=UPI0036C9BA2F
MEASDLGVGGGEFGRVVGVLDEARDLRERVLVAGRGSRAGRRRAWTRPTTSRRTTAGAADHRRDHGCPVTAANRRTQDRG